MVWEKSYTLRAAARQPFVRERLPFLQVRRFFAFFFMKGRRCGIMPWKRNSCRGEMVMIDIAALSMDYWDDLMVRMAHH